MERDEERIQTLNDIIVGISRRSAYKFKTLSVDELSQSLWLRVLETESKLDCPLDLDLVAKICYREITDIQRYEMRRNALSLDVIVDTPSTESNPDTVHSQMMIDDLLKIFPPDSPEGKFLRYWMTATNIEDFGYRPQGKYESGFTENELAKVLGYRDSSHRGYRRFRENMRGILRNYFK